MQEPQRAPVPAGGAQVSPIRADAPQAAHIDAPAPPDPAEDLKTYALAVSRAIKAHLVMPSNVPDTASAIYEITLSRSGAVTQLRAVKQSGFPVYDAAIRRAIQRAQPFPQPPSVEAEKPTRLRLAFKVKD